MAIPSLAANLAAISRPFVESHVNQRKEVTRPNRAPVGMPARKSLVMRKYKTSSLTADGSIRNAEQIAPAMPAFEAAFSGFARGTLLNTVNGPVAVEDLQPGMKMLTPAHGPSPLMWVGSMTLVPNNDGLTPVDARLTRIMADTFGPARPSPGFMAGPGARLLTRPTTMRESFGAEQVLTPVRDLIDGVNVIEITPPRPVTVYHICLRRHATITAAGLEVESFHPGPGFESAMGPNMLTLFLSLFSHIKEPGDFGDLSHPRLPLLSPQGMDAA